MGSIGIEHLKALKYVTTVDILLRRKFIKPFYTTSTTTPSLPTPLKTHTYTFLYRFWLFKETHQKAVETGPRRNNRVLTFILTYNASVNSSSAHPLHWATVGHLLTLSVPGVGHLQFYRGLGAGHLRTPGWAPGIWHTCFRKCHGWAFVEQWLIRQALEKLVDVLKVCFLNLRYFFITCKHINISNKVNYILFITKQSLT